MGFGGIAKDGRAHVRLRLVGRYEGTTASEGAGLVMVVDERIPTVCSVHGQPEVTRLTTFVNTGRQARPMRWQARIIGEKAAADAHTWGDRAQYPPRVISFDWPLCARCAVVTRIARVLILLIFGIGAGFVLAAVLLGAGGVAPENMGWFATFVMGAPHVAVLAIGVWHIRQGWLGFEAPVDGSVLVVADAHPNFVRELEEYRTSTDRG